ncbi:MAG: hypothetical protein ACTTJM_09180 [Bergeyella cardium]|mgnify:CR=1 FL=1
MNTPLFYQIRASIDPKIIGRSELPITIQIKDKVFYEQAKKYMFNIDEYFKDKDLLYDKFPKNLTGKIYQRKKQLVDIMLTMPYYPTLRFVISQKVKNIFEKLMINKSEYHLEEFSIEGSDDNFYFLFIPLLRDIDYIDYTKSVFYNYSDDTYIIMETYEKYRQEVQKGNHIARALYVDKSLQNRDIINLQSGKFYSKRLIDTFQKEGVIGYDIVSEEGFSRKELYFL